MQQSCDSSQKWLHKVCSIIDRYTQETQRNPDYIAYELLDCNPLNEDSVEALYSEAEQQIYAAIEKRKFEELGKLEKEYDEVLVWFEPDLKARLDNITRVVVHGDDNAAAVQISNSNTAKQEQPK